MAAQGRRRLAPDRRASAPGRLADLRQHGREDHARAWAGRPPGQQAQEHHPPRLGPLARRRPAAARLSATAANRRWVGDGTEIPTGQGPLQLAAVSDLFSRRIVGYAISEHHDAALALGALQMAVAVRGGDVAGVVMHTDRGSEYTAGLFRQACRRLGVEQSMGRTGSALDNAPAEALFSSMEFELLRLAGPFDTHRQARAAVAAWVEDFNHERLHTANGLRPPVEFEQLDVAEQDKIRARIAEKKQARRKRRAAARQKDKKEAA
ncbi:IS3 family transposase [Nonomuraea sp. NBC_00507]|uniref:IS3 family transposase n=1 Tax=Nonomuraea sp. NBC_00507 TaxID=2976002 RepID=UPI003FA52753